MRQFGELEPSSWTGCGPPAVRPALDALTGQTSASSPSRSLSRPTAVQAPPMLDGWLVVLDEHVWHPGRHDDEDGERGHLDHRPEDVAGDAAEPPDGAPA